MARSDRRFLSELDKEMQMEILLRLFKPNFYVASCSLLKRIPERHLLPSRRANQHHSQTCF
jgi:hypothetical protein